MFISRAIDPQRFTLTLYFDNNQDTLNRNVLKRGERLGGRDKEWNGIEPKSYTLGL